MSYARPLYLPAEVKHIPHLAIGLTRSLWEGRVVSHVGLLYRPLPKASIEFLELTIDGDTHKRPSDKVTLVTWAIPNLPPLTLQMLAANCENIAKTKRNLGYWFAYSGEALRAQGKSIELPKDKIGLTCATFVLAVIAMRGRKLLDLASWGAADEARLAEDGSWQAWAIERMRQGHWPYGLAPGEDIAARAARDTCLRYRPEEVVASCVLGTENTKFEDAEPCGKWIVRMADSTFDLRKQS